MDALTPKTQSTEPLRESWINALFARISASYGAKFADMWAGQDVDAVKSTWAEELAGYSSTEIRTGLGAMRRTNPSWPPTLFEFAELCRPTKFDHEAAFAEAVKGIYARKEGKPGQWSHPAVFWAVQDVTAHDVLGCTWPQIRSRWTRALDKRMADPNLPQIPDVPKALPEPPREYDLPPAVAATVSALTDGKKGDKRAWVAAILARKERNDPTLTDIAYRMALDSVNVR